MDKKKRKVSSAMKPYIEFVLKRDGIPYEAERESDYWMFTMSISNRRFTEVLEDALCEKQRNQYKSRIPVYSFRTLKNRDKLERLMCLNQKRGYHILKQDETKYFAAVDHQHWNEMSGAFFM